MMRKLIDYPFSTLTRKTSLILILTITTIVILDSTIVKFASYTGLQLPTLSNVGIFLTFLAIFSVIFILSSYMTKKVSESTITLPINIQYFRTFFLSSQILIITIIFTIILQMILSNKYNIILVRAETYLTYISTLFFLISLVLIFVGWYRSKRNYIIMLFTLSFALLAINIVISLIYLDSYFYRSVKLDILPYPITSFVTNFGGSAFHQQLAFVHDILSILSFSFMWLAISILISHYRFKYGRLKYFILISIPLVYYLFPFEAYFGNVFFSLILDSPVSFAIVYILIFSATKQIGALFFSIFFLISSKLVSRSRVRQSILISAIGMATIFGSLEIATLQYSVYPPFGLITTAFMPFGSYLLFTGIFSFALNISKNIAIRRELFISVNSQIDLLKAIGIIQMEKEVQRKFQVIAKRTNIPKYMDNFNLDNEEIKELISDVVQEVSRTRKDIRNP
jgi:hypothetical protein